MTEPALPVIFLTGATGQVGGDLATLLSPLGVVHAPTRQLLDLHDLAAVRDAIRALRPNVIINAAAYTQVDQAESDEAAAHRINAELPAVLAEEADKLAAPLVHYSTDYVFNGEGVRPYREDDLAAPQNAYGRTKRAGEVLMQERTEKGYILRLAWVYSRRGRNFLRTIQRLGAEREEIRVVNDQTGTPTWSWAVAEATVAMLRNILRAKERGADLAPSGIYHLASPDHTTWHGFADAIVSAFPSEQRRPRVIPIPSAEFPTPAKRPAYSVMDSGLMQRTFGLQLPPWREQLRQSLAAPQ